MELKALEIYGFKSFASRTKIKFDRGITGIVGPNGSGKSNIVDAIMWGLGVQSARQLRGQRMEDIIFAGTSKKKPLNFAEVILTFDNSSHLLDIEYDEVSIKRKIYRSGESEFYINQQKVRLRDIQELFMDTGVGRDGYSFIGQGQIDSIINSKPIDRRQVFEEAAGITKYKKRKEESLRSLKKTEENLQRLSDILGEIKSQHEHLRIESERATKYRTYKEQRDLSNGSFLFLNLKQIQEKVHVSQSNLQETMSNRKHHEVKLDESMEKAQELSSIIDEKKAQDQEWQNQRLLLTREFQSIKSQLENNSDLTRRMTAEQSNQESEKTRIQGEIKEIEHSITDANVELDKIQKQLVQKEEEVNRSRKIFNEGRSKLQKEKNKLSNLMDSQQLVHINRTQLESKIDAYQYMINERGERLTRLEEMSGMLDNQFRELEETLNKKFQQEEQQKVDLDNLSHKSDMNQHEITDLSKDLETQQIKYDAMVRRQDTIMRELNFLKRMKENHEGYSSAVKRFLKMQQHQMWTSSVVGTVAESIHIKEPFYTAVSTALGGAAQNIIVETDRYIHEMIQLLKDHRLGRVTFLPLNTIHPHPIIVSSLPKVDYPIYLGHDCVDVPEKLSGVVEFLLGRILIVESLDDGRDLSKKIRSRYRIVTLDGQVFNVGGSITGGSHSQGQKDLFNRKSQIAKLENQLENLTHDLETVTDELDEVKTSMKEKKLLEITLSDEISQRTEELRLVTSSIEKYRQSVEDVERRREDLKREIQSEIEEIRARTNEVDELSAKLDSNLVETNQEELTALTEWVQEYEDKLNEDRDELSAAEIELTKYRSNLNFTKEQIQHLKKNKESHLNQIHSIISKEEETTKELDELKESRIQLEKKHKSLSQSLNESEENLMKIRTIIQNIENDVEDLQSSQQKLQVELRKLERREGNLTIKFQNLKEQYKDTLLEFNQLPESIRKKASESEVSLEKLKKIISEMDAKIDSLGYINFNAIEEFKEIDERYQFTINQREDLYLSKDKLEDVIQSLDREMTKVFKSTIREVQGYFQEIFVQLFQGGQASIELVNEGDILESGIEITAQPPGKKLQSLTLLSGGERSMTAVALLFALLRKRKSPFCILDEIDAALDEANIARYTGYLRQLEGIQFIMITHRKSTMEIAESLYGITMEEKGISSVISMKLEE